MKSIAFADTDFVQEQLPTPGLYRSHVVSAEFRKSAKGNQMLQVVHELTDVSVGQNRVWEYFVVEGQSRAVALARRRLVQLYRSCGLDPKQGDRLAPEDLLDAQLEVRVEHDAYNGQLRLRVTGYQMVEDESVPF